MVIGGDGVERELTGADPRIVRGKSPDMAGADFAGMITEAGVEGLLLMPDGRRLWVEPLHGRVPTALSGDHIVYRDADRLDGGAACGASGSPWEESMRREAALLRQYAAAASAVADDDFAGGPNDVRFAEIALDSDVEFFNAAGSVANVEAEVANLINIVNLQYERDVRISHTIVRMVVRTAEPDPYNTSHPSNLLDEFRNHWFASQGTVQRDVAHFFTGRSLSNDVAGIAYVTGICSDVEGYSMVSRAACASLACETDLSAHELGHNWGAPHCNCPGYTMNPVVQGSNVFHPEFSVPPIITYRDTRACLEIGDDLEGLALSADSPTVAEGNRLRLLAEAEFRLHADIEVTPLVEWTVVPPALGVIDDQGDFHPADVTQPTLVTISAAYAFDGVIQTDDLALTVVNAPPAPLRDTLTPEKNRYLSLAAPPEAGEVAVAVKLVTIHEPDPPYLPGVFVPDFSAYQGEIRWVGPPQICQEPGGGSTPYRCAKLQCDPHYSADWGTTVIHVTGGDILPSSQFEIRTYPVFCAGRESACPLTSAPLIMRTQRWGDVAADFQAPGGPPGTASQPNVIDIGMMVSKLKGLPPLTLPEAELSSLDPDLNGVISVIEVGQTVDAVKGFGPVFLSPCSCPSLSVCPFLDQCGRCRP